MKKTVKKNAGPRRNRSDFVAEQRARLEEMTEHLTRRTVKVDRDLRREGDAFERDFEEQAAARENDEVLSALSGEGRDQLGLIQKAIARIEAGDYGACEVCGERILRVRLVACPYATRCLACAK